MADFFAGNLGRVDLISEYEYDLFIRPDTCNPRFRLWFNFIVDNIRTDQVSRCNLLYFGHLKYSHVYVHYMQLQRLNSPLPKIGFYRNEKRLVCYDFEC